MAPLTWDRHTPAPGQETLDQVLGGTEPTPTFEPSDLGDGFGEAEGEQTVITTASPYDLKSRFTGRTASIRAIEEQTDKAFDQRQSRVRGGGRRAGSLERAGSSPS